MNKEIIRTGWQLLKDNYKGDVDLGTTEYSIRKVNGNKSVLVPGSNEKADWKKNFNITIENGIKKVGVDAMEEILADTNFHDEEPLYWFTHSKSVPTGVSLAKYAKDNKLPWKVVGWNPARSISRFVSTLELDNLILFRNRFDPVSEVAGFFTLTHPKCKTFFNWSYKHGLEHWEKYLDKMEEQIK